MSIWTAWLNTIAHRHSNARDTNNPQPTSGNFFQKLIWKRKWQRYQESQNFISEQKGVWEIWSLVTYCDWMQWFERTVWVIIKDYSKAEFIYTTCIRCVHWVWFQISFLPRISWFYNDIPFHCLSPSSDMLFFKPGLWRVAVLLLMSISSGNHSLSGGQQTRLPSKATKKCIAEKYVPVEGGKTVK